MKKPEDKFTIVEDVLKRLFTCRETDVVKIVEQRRSCIVAVLQKIDTFRKNPELVIQDDIDQIERRKEWLVNNLRSGIEVITETI